MSATTVFSILLYLVIKLDYYSSVSLLLLYISYEANNCFDMLMTEDIIS